jgi:hypothetical protein
MFPWERYALTDSGKISSRRVRASARKAACGPRCPEVSSVQGRRLSHRLAVSEAAGSLLDRFGVQWWAAAHTGLQFEY